VKTNGSVVMGQVGLVDSSVVSFLSNIFFLKFLAVKWISQVK
jgi:hypothetical protein